MVMAVTLMTVVVMVTVRTVMGLGPVERTRLGAAALCP